MINTVEIVEMLKKEDKETVLLVVYYLMSSGKFSFTDLCKVHERYLNEVIQLNTDELVKLRWDIINMWVGNKKDVGKELVSLIQGFKDKGCMNITQEAIDNSKWNKSNSKTKQQ